MILDSFAWLLCLHPITFFFLPVSLHFSHRVFLSVLNSRSLHFFPLSPQCLSLSLMSPSVCTLFHFYIFSPHSLSLLHQTSDIFSHLSLSLASPLFVCLFLPHLFLGLSISICLRGQFGFSQGCTLTRWNGVSLFLRWWRHFAVRITALDIDRKETRDFRGHHEQAGKRGRAPNQHTSDAGREEYRRLGLTVFRHTLTLFVLII